MSMRARIPLLKGIGYDIYTERISPYDFLGQRRKVRVMGASVKTVYTRNSSQATEVMVLSFCRQLYGAW